MKGAFLGGVPVIRIIAFGGLGWGPPIDGNHHLVLTLQARMVSSIGLAAGSTSQRIMSWHVTLHPVYITYPKP